MTELQRDGRFDSAWVRAQFPALATTIDGVPILHFDNPAGTQVPARTVAAISRYLVLDNANTESDYPSSQRTEAIVASARRAMAAFVGAASPAEILFGPNMTSLAHGMSRLLGRLWSPGDEVIVTELDHDSNVRPWLELEERGIVVRRISLRLEDCTLDLDALPELLNSRTRLIAITAASNIFGSVTELRRVAHLARSTGAWLWVDAVHFGPHGPIDVQAWDVDFLVCSAYKFFGPHAGILWARASVLQQIMAHRAGIAPVKFPQAIEIGAKNHEALAGLLATLDYLAELGRRCGSEPSAENPMRDALAKAMSETRTYERTLTAALLEGLDSVRGLRLYGVSDRRRLESRVPTVAFSLRLPSPEVSRLLAEHHICVRSGQFYAPTVMPRLGLAERGGVLRVGAVHYNTIDEIDRLVEILKRIAA